MTWLYAPFIGKKPASATINGHRLVIVAHEPELIESGLKIFGADRVQRIRSGSSQTAQSKTLQRIGRQAKSSIVVAPPQAELEEVIHQLESDLPWVQ